MRTIRNSIYNPILFRYISGYPRNDAHPMYVCICHAVTDRDIRACIEDGANSMHDLRKRLCVGTQCGKCARHAREILKEEKSGATSNPFSGIASPA